MLGISFVHGFKISWLGKSDVFRGPFRPFFKWLGGIPVDRSAPNGLVQQVVDVYNSSDELIIGVPPEGTRGKVDGWKTGFYYIALGAEVPLVCAFLDFENKRGGFGPRLEPSGDIEADLEILREFYEPIRGKFPELESPIQVRSKRRYEAPREKRRLGKRVAGTSAKVAQAMVAAVPWPKRR